MTNRGFRSEFHDTVGIYETEDSLTFPNKMKVVAELSRRFETV